MHRVVLTILAEGEEIAKAIGTGGKKMEPRMGTIENITISSNLSFVRNTILYILYIEFKTFSERIFVGYNRK